MDLYLSMNFNINGSFYNLLKKKKYLFLCYYYIDYLKLMIYKYYKIY